MNGLRMEPMNASTICLMIVAWAVLIQHLARDQVIFSRRSRAIAAWLTGLDLAFVSAALESREIYIEVGLDTQYLLARMRTPTQTLEAETFEATKGQMSGLHFLSVQSGPEAEQPDGFWLLRDTEAAARGRR